MLTWVLILTMAMNDSRGGVSLQTIDGFTSQNQCLNAASAWLKQANQLSPVWVRAVCVPKGF